MGEQLDQEEVKRVALDYVRSGIAVIPVYPPDCKFEGVTDPGKQPKRKRWQTRRLTEAEVEKEFSRRSNLGVVCGEASRIVCIDVDAKHGGLAWYYAHDDGRLGRHLLEHTGGGGLHLFYRYPASVSHVPSLPASNPLAPGVEVKADGGFQVVTWPSVHPSGARYTFEHGLTLLDLADEADELPEWILQAIVARKAEEETRKAAPVAALSKGGFTDDPQDIERALRRVAGLGHRAEHEGRNALAYSVTAVGRDHGVSPKAWWPHVKAWNQGNRPPLDDGELKKTFRSGYTYPRGAAGERSVAAGFADDPPEPPVEDPTARLSPREEAEQADELGIPYPHKNPVVSARRFLGTLADYCFGLERHHVYADDTWSLRDDSFMNAVIWRAIVDADPDVALKDSHVVEIRKALQRDRYVPAPSYDTWRDSRPGDFVRVQNGILDLNRVELLPHSPDWFSCTKLPFGYDSAAECPAFLAFLGSLWAHMPDQIEALQQWFGYVLSRDTSQQMFGMLLGPSRSGKGTILRVLGRLLGEENCLATTVNAIGSPFGLGSAVDKKLIVIGDAHDGTREASNAAAEVIKLITGEDLVRIERKYEQAQDIRLRAKIVIAANQMPKLVDLRSSIINRMLLFRFTESFAGREDLGLDERLRAEMPGILNWAIRGLEDLKAAGRLKRPESSQAKLAEIEESLNPVDAFIGDFIGYVPNNPLLDDPCVLMVDEAYQLYKLWCGEAGHKACAKSRFSSALGEFFANRHDVKRERVRRGGTVNQTFFTNLELLVSVDHYRGLVASKGFPADDDEDSNIF